MEGRLAISMVPVGGWDDGRRSLMVWNFDSSS